MEFWEVFQRNLSNLTDSMATERKIYVTATKTDTRDNQSLSTTRLHFVFGLIHRTHSETDPAREVPIFRLCEDFDHSFERFTSPEEAKAVVASMFSQLQIPFTFDRESVDQGLHWKELIGDHNTSAVDRVPLQGLDDIVTRISEAAARVAREASASGRKAVQMVVTMDMRTAIPQQEFERLERQCGDLGASPLLDPENPGLCRKIDLGNCFLSLFSSPNFSLVKRRPRLDRHRLEDGDEEYLRPLNQVWTQSNHNHEREMTRTIEHGFSQSASAFAPMPASKAAVEALEKFVYERSGEDEDEPKSMTCMICMEEVMIGSHLTRMPCSHVYHFDCITQWLLKNHTCPICRFKLPSNCDI